MYVAMAIWLRWLYTLGVTKCVVVTDNKEILPEQVQNAATSTKISLPAPSL